MKKITIITRVVICSVAAAVAVVAWINNPAHLVTAAIIFAVGLNAQWEEREEDRV